MPSHLHPRSRTTTSLFGMTLVVSFLVVGMPHILPCPAPRTTYADVETTEDGRVIRRRRRKSKAAYESVGGAGAERATETGTNDTPSAVEGLRGCVEMQKKTRECPVPKPGGLIGQVLGFGPIKQKGREEGRR